MYSTLLSITQLEAVQSSEYVFDHILGSLGNSLCAGTNILLCRALYQLQLVKVEEVGISNLSEVIVQL